MAGQRGGCLVGQWLVKVSGHDEEVCPSRQADSGERRISGTGVALHAF